MGLKHLFHSAKADPADPTIIGATKWNADHYYVDGAGAPIGNVGALLLAGAAGALTHLNSVAAGQVLTSAGVGALPVWAAAGAGAHAATHYTGGSDPLTGALALASLDATGVIHATGNLTTDASLVVGAGAWLYFAGRTILQSPADGRLLVQNTAGNDFSLLQFGGTTNAFPSLKRSTNELQVKTADDSSFANLYAASVWAMGAGGYFSGGSNRLFVRWGAGSPEGVVDANVGALYLRTDGGATTTLYVKTSGTATTTGWTAK